MKGYYKPINPNKYIGDSKNIVWRSRWEMVFMSYLDKHDNVLRWASEELKIPYRSPIDNRIHRYYPDFWVEKKNRQGKIDVVVIEIKPYYQTQKPKVKSRVTKQYLYEVQTWSVNQAKWESAINYCNSKGWRFEIITEKELGLKF